MNLTAKHPSDAAPASDVPEPTLSVQNLSVSVETQTGPLPLIKNINFTLARGETLALAGESGSGKSITSLAIMGLLPPPAVRVSGGSIMLGHETLTTLPEADLRALYRSYQPGGASRRVTLTWRAWRANQEIHQGCGPGGCTCDPCGCKRGG